MVSALICGCLLLNNIKTFRYEQEKQQRRTSSTWQFQDSFGWTNDNMILATEKERQKLFDALKADGKRWNDKI